MALYETKFIVKDGRVAGSPAAATSVGGLDLSMWEYEGTPSHGAPPTTWANPDNTTQGAIGQANASGGRDKLLTSVHVASLWNGGLLVLWDRLLHVGGFDGTVATAQNVNGGSDATLSRHYVDGVGVQDIGNEIWLEIYAQVGATPQTVTCAYKNELGVSHTTQSVAFGNANFREAQRFIRLPLAAGDRGVRSVTSVTLSGSTGTAGNFGLVVCHRLLSFVMDSGNPELWTGATEGDMIVMPGACLFWTWNSRVNNPTSTVIALPMTSLAFAEK